MTDMHETFDPEQQMITPLDISHLGKLGLHDNFSAEQLTQESSSSSVDDTANELLIVKPFLETCVERDGFITVPVDLGRVRLGRTV